MPGFYVSNISVDVELKNTFNENCIKSELSFKNYIVKRNTLNKFMLDKIFIENEEYIVVLEGVILNKSNLIKKYNKISFEKTIINMIDNSPETFFNELNGSFSGAVFDKKNESWIIWTNQLGDNAVFYYYEDNKFIIASQVNYILDALKKIKAKLTLDEQAVYSMLTYGWMYDERTYSKEIKRLMPGSYIIIKNNKINVKNYYFIKNDSYNLLQISEKEIIEIVNEKFKNAVKIEFDKDLEYGYRHISDLSGGYDSRMTTWVANKMGYGNILNLHYSHNNSFEEIITKEIASYLKHEMILKPLDDASFFYEVDNIVSMNYGLGIYSGITGGKQLLDLLKFNNLGIEHTGFLGDVILGSFINKISELNVKNKKIVGQSSSKLISKLDCKHIDFYPNKEIQMMYIRGLLGANSTILIRKNYTEVCSPFLNLDFLSFCMSIPIEMRINHKIYRKWIIQKYPQAGDIRWTGNFSKATDLRAVTIIRNLFKRAPHKILRTIFKNNEFILKSKMNMNLYTYYYATDERIKKFIDQYFFMHINQNIIPNTIKQDLIFLFNNGSCSEKCQVITVLAAIKYYFE